MKRLLFYSLLFAGIALSARAHEPRRIFQKAWEKVDTAALFQGKWSPYPDYSDRAGWDEFFGEHKEAIIREGESKLNYQWQTILATDYLEFERTGDRMIMQIPTGQNESAIRALTLAELAEGRGRFMDQIINGVWNQCERTSWVLSAHQYRQKSGRALPDYRDIFIDLGTHIMGTQLAADLYFFGKEWDKIDPCISAKLRHAFEVQVFNPYLDDSKWKSQSWLGFTKEGEQTPYFWENWDPRNNWNIWCNTSISYIYAYAQPDRKVLMAGLQNAIKSADNYLDYVDMDGGCDEGPAYWYHATGCLYEFIALMNELSGGQFGCLDDPQYRARARYISRVNLSDGWSVNFSDGTATSTGTIAIAYYMGKFGNDPEMLNYAFYQAAEQNVRSIFAYDEGTIFYYLDALRFDKMFKEDFEKALADAGGDIEKLKLKCRSCVPAGTWYPGTQHFIFKSKSGVQYAAKAGHNEESHNHNDVGTVILFDSNMPVLVDVGPTTYMRQTFNKKERYTIWSMRSEWHNLPLMNGRPQHDGREYAAAWSKADAVKGSFSAEIAGAYESEAQCRSLIRTCSLVGRTFTISDKFELAGRTAPDEEHFMVRGEVEDLGNGRLKITYHDRNLSKSGTAILTYSKGLVPIIETKVLDDPRHSKVWGPELKRIILRSADDAPLKGTYKIQIQL